MIGHPSDPVLTQLFHLGASYWKTAVLELLYNVANAKFGLSVLDHFMQD